MRNVSIIGVGVANAVRAHLDAKRGVISGHPDIGVARIEQRQRRCIGNRLADIAISPRYRKQQGDAVAIPGLAGPVTLRNNTLPGNPRVYFVVNPSQSARVRAVQNGTNLVATILQQSYADLAAAPSGDSVAPITPETFGPTTSFCPQPVLTLPGCVGSATQFTQLLPMSSAGRSDNILFTLCSNYSTSNPNTLRVSRPPIICTLPSPALCPSNSGMVVTLTRSSGAVMSGPAPLQNGGASTLTLSGPGWLPGESYCLAARQVNPWEGAFNYEFRLLGTPQL